MNASRKRHAVASGALLCSLGALLVLAACEAKIPTSAEISAMDVARAEKSAAEAGFMRTPANDRTDFFLNGVPVSAERARAIEAKDIGSIEIVKSELPTGRDTIFVTSADRLSRRVPDSVEANLRLAPGEYAVMRKKVSEASSEKLVAHVEAERAAERMRTADASASKAPAPPPPMRMKMRSGEAAPVILIDGKRASEAQLAALEEKDIAAMAVYKGKERLDFLAKGKDELEVTSSPPGIQKPADDDAVISVTTKIARAKARTKQP